MAVITLTTDLGLVDNYVASVKGAILKETPEITIVDITHEVPSFDLQKSAFILRNCYQDFPEGTVHIIGVNSEADVNIPHVALYANGHYFIGADNGIFSLIFDNPPEKVVELTISQDTDRITFPTKDVFVKAACHIARGGTLEVIGTAKHELSVRTMFRAVSENNIIKGIATYIDHYGNVITNISEKLFKEYGNGRSFKILFRSAEYEIDEISLAYSSVVEGERVALFSSTGYIEIAINKANANKLFGINQGDIIRIEFYD
ncbi:MAG: SAM-dependent chlorinase/fluorinase [Flavobacteriales bacterium]|nr:SAM-dependent chlorinase/fluorinase [Flavobacteriales bacterium]NQX97968.1 SAM-dependent chlorinase/fluorinase [Flavobacteriales bacterium]